MDDQCRVRIGDWRCERKISRRAARRLIRSLVRAKLAHFRTRQLGLVPLDDLMRDMLADQYRNVQDWRSLRESLRRSLKDERRTATSYDRACRHHDEASGTDRMWADRDKSAACGEIDNLAACIAECRREIARIERWLEEDVPGSVAFLIAEDARVSRRLDLLGTK